MSKIRPTQIQTPGDATKYLDGTGAFSTPAGTGGGGTTLGRLYVANSGVQSYSSGSFSKFTAWGTPTDDPLSNWDATNKQWAAPAAGTYLIVASLGWAAASGGARIVAIFINGSELDRSEYSPNLTTGDSVFAQVTAMPRLASADKVTVFAFQDSGSSINTSGGKLSIHQLADTG